ncbi:adenylate kinase [Lignipirellula cremea]|uniref:Adenylate kinase n=1 Tax=Lignipirellula cremea TaxID=2528010 RepID=A0A518DMX1_9BACT|nr:adenylate kinase [Lignipirellula cremea]QDU93190.1 Adenylate kinase [Lignipirellula cremea]
MPMRIVFIGPPGAGKGTQSVRLVKYLDVPHLSTGDMLRDAISEGTTLGKLVKSYMDHGSLVPDPLVVGIVGERLEHRDCRKGCMLDGFPRTIGQAQALDQYLLDRGEKIDVVLELQVPEEILHDRLLERAKKMVEPRSDDRPEAIPRRLSLFRSQTEPLISYYSKRDICRHVDGVGTPDEVFARIRECVDSMRPGGKV